MADAPRPRRGRTWGRLTGDVVRRHERDVGEDVGEAQVLEDAPRAGPDPDARADLGERVGRLVDVDGDAGRAGERGGEDEPADAASAGGTCQREAAARRGGTHMMATLVDGADMVVGAGAGERRRLRGGGLYSTAGARRERARWR